MAEYTIKLSIVKRAACIVALLSNGDIASEESGGELDIGNVGVLLVFRRCTTT